MKSTSRKLTITLVLCLLATAPLFGGEKPYVIALTPDGLSQPERVPLQEYLVKQLGHEVKLTIPNSYNELMDALGNGSIDFAWLGGVTYVLSHARLGVVPLVQRTTDLQFRALYITGANTSIHSLRDLKGKKFAFGDINSTSGHIIPYLEMKQAGINPDKDIDFRYSGGHSLTAKLVESGIVDAGAIDETIFNSMIAGKKIDDKKVRVFHTSRQFVDYVWVARKGVPAEDREKFANALLDLKEGRDDGVLRILRGTKFIRANDGEYSSVRQAARELKMFSWETANSHK